MAKVFLSAGHGGNDSGAAAGMNKRWNTMEKRLGVS